MAGDDVLQRLMQTIRDRQQHATPNSYTATLFAGGTQRIGRKVLEEAAEVVQAAAEPGPAGQEHLVREAADLLYHLWVLLAHRDVSLEEVQRELTRREGTSGLEEKASRGAGPPPEG